MKPGVRSFHRVSHAGVPCSPAPAASVWVFGKMSMLVSLEQMARSAESKFGDRDSRARAVFTVHTAPRLRILDARLVPSWPPYASSSSRHHVSPPKPTFSCPHCSWPRGGRAVLVFACHLVVIQGSTSVHVGITDFSDQYDGHGLTMALHAELGHCLRQGGLLWPW